MSTMQPKPIRANPPASFSDPLATPVKRAANPSGERRFFRVEKVTAGGLGTALLGRSSIKPDKLAETINACTGQGWRFDFATVSTSRMLIFWKRETVLVYLSRAA